MFRRTRLSCSRFVLTSPGRTLGRTPGRPSARRGFGRTYANRPRNWPGRETHRDRPAFRMSAPLTSPGDPRTANCRSDCRALPPSCGRLGRCRRRRPGMRCATSRSFAFRRPPQGQTIGRAVQCGPARKGRRNLRCAVHQRRSVTPKVARRFAAPSLSAACSPTPPATPCSGDLWLLATVWQAES